MLAYAGNRHATHDAGARGAWGRALEGSCEPQGQITPPGLGGMIVAQAWRDVELIRRGCQTNLAGSDIYSQS